MRIVLIAGLFAVGCGGSSGSGGKPLDCAYLASADNCWETTATASTSCLPADTAMGVLAADNGSCTYASGQTVTFTPPLTLPLPDHFKDWNFTVTNNGSECVHFMETSDGMQLTVHGDVVNEQITGTAGIDLTCPDGTTYSTTNGLALLSCPGTSFGNLPGNATSSSATSVSFQLIDTGVSGGIRVFDCSR